MPKKHFPYGFSQLFLRTFRGLLLCSRIGPASIWQYTSKVQISTPFDPASPLLRISSIDIITHMGNEVCTVDERKRLNKILFLHTMEYHLGIFLSEEALSIQLCKHLRDTLLNE